MGNFGEYLKESKVVWTIKTFDNFSDYMSGKVANTSTFEGNILLNNGITALLQLLGGTASPNAYNNSNAKIGVGDTPTPAADPAQTGLQAPTNKVYVGMDTSYPTVVNQTITFRATFASDVANFDWREFVIINSATTDTIALNRKVENQGVKYAGQVREVTLAITLS